MLPSFRQTGLREVLSALTRAIRLDLFDGSGFVFVCRREGLFQVCGVRLPLARHASVVLLRAAEQVRTITIGSRAQPLVSSSHAFFAQWRSSLPPP